MAQKTKKTTKSHRKNRVVKSTPKAVKSTPKAVKSTPKAVKSTPKAVKGTARAVKGTARAVKGTARAVKGTAKPVKGMAKPVKGTTKASKSRAKTIKSKAESRKISTKAAGKTKKTVSGRTSAKSTAAPKKAAAKTKKAAVRTVNKKTSKSKKRVIKESRIMEAEMKKVQSSGKEASGTNTQQGLLRQTKATSSALSHLGKSIELIYKKDYKKARSELTTLVQSFPEEPEILARARSYLQICNREEEALKKPEISQDQLYSLGVLEHNKANYDTAISYFLQSLKKHPDADYIYYSVAASLARKGDRQASIEHLKKAIELNEDSRIFARNDEDFSLFETDEEFAELLGILPNPGTDPQ